MDAAGAQAYAGFFEGSKTALAVLGTDGAIERVNAAWSSRLAFARPPGSLLDRVAPGDRAALAEALAAARKRGAAEVAVRFVAKDGAEEAFACELSTDPDRRWIYVAARPAPESAADAALRERLTRSEAEFRRLLDFVPDGVVVMHEGTFAYANPAAARILGYDAPEELIGVHFASIVRPEELPESDERVRMMGGAAPPPRRLRPMVRRDGTTVYAETLGFRTELDGAPATLVIARDVTEERRLAAQMRQAERLASLGTLAATLAHEINNPLTYILLNLQVIRRLLARLASDGGSGVVGDALHLVDQTLEGADRVRVVARDLRGFARADDEVESLVDVRAVLDSVIPIAEHELRARASAVRAYDDASPEPLVRANAAVLGHVFLNVLVNAAQAIPHDGRADHEVRIGVRAVESPGGGGEVTVTIRDTGVGMSRDVRERIFDPFFSTKPAGVGTGLGLSLALQHVQALDGVISVESEVGLGSTFTIRLPLARASAADDEPEQVGVEPVALPRLKILIVDDEPRIAERIAEILERHDVVRVADGRAALLRLREEPFDVVFCDLMMPEMKGTEVFEQTCREQPHLASRFVFMTAGAFTPRARALLDRGSNPRLDKPFSAAEVEKVLALVVSKRAGGGAAAPASRSVP